MGIKEEEEGEEAFARDLENVVGTLREEREKIRELGTGKLLRRDGGLAMFAFLMTEGFESLSIEFLIIFVCLEVSVWKTRREEAYQFLLCS